MVGPRIGWATGDLMPHTTDRNWLSRIPQSLAASDWYAYVPYRGGPAGFGRAYRPSVEELHLGYWAPERQAVRTGLVEAVKRARSGQDLDDDPVRTAQHRHAAGHRGWWD